jgi:hypothetical protein
VSTKREPGKTLYTDAYLRITLQAPGEKLLLQLPDFNAFPVTSRFQTFTDGLSAESR